MICIVPNICKTIDSRFHVFKQLFINVYLVTEKNFQIYEQYHHKILLQFFSISFLMLFFKFEVDAKLNLKYFIVIFFSTDHSSSIFWGEIFLKYAFKTKQLTIFHLKNKINIFLCIVLVICKTGNFGLHVPHSCDGICNNIYQHFD